MQQVGIQLVDPKFALGLLGAMTGLTALDQDRSDRLPKESHVRLWDDVSGSRNFPSLFQESGFYPSLFFGRFQRNRRHLSIGGQNCPGASEHKQRRLPYSLHRFLVLIQFRRMFLPPQGLIGTRVCGGG